MFNLVDQLLKMMLDMDWTISPAPAKPDFYFSVPDEAWYGRVINGTKSRINLYLYEVRENRNFRRSSWDHVDVSGQTTAISQPPAYIDCHYLVTAWSPTKEIDPTTSPVPEEHELLAEALRIFMRNPAVVPSTIGFTGGSPLFHDSYIYLAAAPSESLHSWNDFWSTMKQPWRPAIELIVTAPLELLREEPVGPVVLTLVQRYVRIDETGNPDEVVLLGGWVLKSTDNAPIQDATVLRVRGSLPNQEVLGKASTDSEGRFVFTGLRGTQHRFRATATGYTALEHTIDIATAQIADHIFKLT